MKTSKEIWAKIDELEFNAQRTRSKTEKENLRCKIDALLWVLGDESGKPI